ncbi:hypothetical protein [Streptomyces sp. NPDC002067]
MSNVINGPVNHSLVIQTGSIEGELHVHTPPAQSPEQTSALTELQQRLDAQERTEKARQQQAQKQREFAHRREQERRRLNRLLALDEAREQDRERRATPLRVLLALTLCAPGLYLLVTSAHRSLFVVLLATFLLAGGIPLARSLPAWTLTPRSDDENTPDSPGRAARNIHDTE